MKDFWTGCQLGRLLDRRWRRDKLFLLGSAFEIAPPLQTMRHVSADDAVPLTLQFRVQKSKSKWGIPRKGYLVPGRDAPRARPNGESSWDVAAAAVAAVTRNGHDPQF